MSLFHRRDTARQILNQSVPEAQEIRGDKRQIYLVPTLLCLFPLCLFVCAVPGSPAFQHTQVHTHPDTPYGLSCNHMGVLILSFFLQPIPLY